MSDKKERASSKLNTRAMMIEQTETELKMIVKNAYKEGHSRRQLSHDTYTAIYRLIRDIGNPALAQKCAISFPRYVNKLNNEYAAVFQLINAYNVKPIFTDPDRTVEIITDDGRTVTIPTLNDIPEYSFDRGVAAEMYGKDYRTEVGKRLRNVAALAAKEDYESNVSLRNVAEMQIRYEKHLDDLDKLTREGVRLVWISTHSNCSKRCQPYQGKLYSLDGTSGKTDEGYTFEPLEVATDVYYTTKRGIRYKNGLFGFNCRHQMTPYTPGSKPTKIPDKVIEHQRELEKTQREYERAIRYEKTLYEVSHNLGTKETDDIARQAWHKSREINAQYKEFCKANNLPYPVERVKIFKDQDPTLFVDRILSKNKLDKREITLVNYLTKDIDSGNLKLGNAATRVWYKREISKIYENIDQSLPMEEKAYLAFEARNRIRTAARDMMIDTEARKMLDKESPNMTFEELIKRKMERGLTREEALADIYRSAETENQNVNKKLFKED